MCTSMMYVCNSNAMRVHNLLIFRPDQLIHRNRHRIIPCFHSLFHSDASKDARYDVSSWASDHLRVICKQTLDRMSAAPREP